MLFARPGLQTVAGCQNGLSKDLSFLFERTCDCFLGDWGSFGVEGPKGSNFSSSHASRASHLSCGQADGRSEPSNCVLVGERLVFYNVALE